MTPAATVEAPAAPLITSHRALRVDQVSGRILPELVSRVTGTKARLILFSTCYEIRSGRTFLALRYSRESAERTAVEFTSVWESVQIHLVRQADMGRRVVEEAL